MYPYPVDNQSPAPGKAAPEPAPAAAAPMYGYAQQMPLPHTMAPNVTYVVAAPPSSEANMMWIAPMLMFVLGFFFLFVFAPFSWMLWIIGAAFMFYPDTLTRALGVVNLGFCCFCGVVICAFVCLFTALFALMTILPPLMIAATAGSMPSHN